MDKLKVLILGSTGMAGHVIYHYLHGTNKYEISDISFRKKNNNDTIILDIRDSCSLNRKITEIRPDIIINCVGILIKGSNNDSANAIYINSYFPHLLRNMTNEVGSKLIHISTDCVFSGKKGNYEENDFRDADDLYGRSKALGEINDNYNLTIRTSIIGPELKKNGEGLFNWFMWEKDTVKGYVNAIWGGVTTLELAKAIDFAIKQNTTGLIQLSNGIGISKYDLLKLFSKIWKNNSIEIIADSLYVCDKSIAKSRLFNYDVPDYETMLFELWDFMCKFKFIYDYEYSFEHSCTNQK